MADPAFIVSRRQRLRHRADPCPRGPRRRPRPPLEAAQVPGLRDPLHGRHGALQARAAGLEDAAVTELPLGARFDAGPFGVEYIGMTHSIPEPNAVLISHPGGAVLHTGDWKLDDAPVVGERYDRRAAGAAQLAAAGGGLRLHQRRGAGQHRLRGRRCSRRCGDRRRRRRARGRDLLRQQRRPAGDAGAGGRGAPGATSASSARPWSAWSPSPAPPAIGPTTCRSWWTPATWAICRGRRCWPPAPAARASRARRWRMAADSHRDILLDPGDTVIFSSKLIPGNERPVAEVQNRLRAMGVDLVTDTDAHVHVSGHPAVDDLERLYDWVQPPAVVPTHGTPRHLRANAEVALRLPRAAGGGHRQRRPLPPRGGRAAGAGPGAHRAAQRRRRRPAGAGAAGGQAQRIRRRPSNTAAADRAS
jgi:ribonuclease J